MPADPRMLELMSYYRDAELHGAMLLLRLMRMMSDDSEAQVKLTKHVAEEARHAWLWTRRMTELGGAPIKIASGYQTRLGTRTTPRTLADLLALTVVVEERSLERYQEHAVRPDVDAATRRVLESVARDERWHIAWIKKKLDELTAADSAVCERVAMMMEHYRKIDREVYAELRAREDEVFGASAWTRDVPSGSAVCRPPVGGGRGPRTVA